MPAGNKYDRGHAVIFGGPLPSTGAARIAARNALRMGAGLVSVACERASLPIYAATLEAVMTKLAETAEQFHDLIADARVRAVAIGPGAGLNDRTRQAIHAALGLHKPLVLDADALRLCAESPDRFLADMHALVVLTPHEGEFHALFPKIDPALAPDIRACEAAARFRSVVVLKGNRTVVAAPDGRCAQMEGATPYLATAGTGDALTGIVTGLLAQGMPAFEAASAAVWLHAHAAAQVGPGLIAEDISEYLPKILSGITG